MTALLREDRLRVTHEGVSGGRKTFVLEPYPLLVYKKGLYLAGLSQHHRAIRTFALDGFRDVEWLKGDRFEYPADYRPEQITEGAFGLIRRAHCCSGPVRSPGRALRSAPPLALHAALRPGPRWPRDDDGGARHGRGCELAPRVWRQGGGAGAAVATPGGGDRAAAGSGPLRLKGAARDS
jgi:hypothetical protein